MRTAFAALLLMAGASVATLAIAQDDKPKPERLFAEQVNPAPALPAPARAAVETTPDARSLAGDQDVAEARRAYRAQCNRYESAPFCECVTAGVAQALMPQEVRIAARTIRDRITAEGDANLNEGTDAAEPGSNSMSRILQVEAHYTDACAQFR